MRTPITTALLVVSDFGCVVVYKAHLLHPESDCIPSSLKEGVEA